MTATLLSCARSSRRVGLVFNALFPRFSIKKSYFKSACLAKVLAVLQEAVSQHPLLAEMKTSLRNAPLILPNEESFENIHPCDVLR
jgi:hypothetical protein